MSRRPRHIGLLTLVLLGLFAVPLRFAAVTAAQVEDTTYTNPSFGWSISWDGDAWTATSDDSTDEGDVLVLEDALNTVYFETYEGFDGSALDCVAAEPDELAAQDAADVTVGVDSRGNEIAGGSDAYAYAVYTFSYDTEDDVTIDLVEYNECRSMSDTHVLEISQLTVREAYNDASPAAQDLIAAVLLPGEEQTEDDRDSNSGSVDSDDADDDANASGNTGDDADGDTGTLGFAEITDITADVSAHLNEYWTDVFANYGIFYVPPIYEVFDDEAETPCSVEPSHAGIDGPFYCGLNQTVYLDLVLTQDFATGYGTPAIYYALAHESAHDVQMALGAMWTGTASVELELEADCMAGSFLQTYVSDGEMTEAEFFVLLDLANSIGDPAGVTASDAGSHGMGSQRVAMLLRGYYNGVDSCGTFPESDVDED